MQSTYTYYYLFVGCLKNILPLDNCNNNRKIKRNILQQTDVEEYYITIDTNLYKTELNSRWNNRRESQEDNDSSRKDYLMVRKTHSQKRKKYRQK